MAEEKERSVVPFKVPCTICNRKEAIKLCQGCGEFYCQRHFEEDAVIRHKHADDKHGYEPMELMKLMGLISNVMTKENLARAGARGFGSAVLQGGAGSASLHIVSGLAKKGGLKPFINALAKAKSVRGALTLIKQLDRSLGLAKSLAPIAWVAVIPLFEAGYHMYRYCRSNEPGVQGNWDLLKMKLEETVIVNGAMIAGTATGVFFAAKAGAGFGSIGGIAGAAIGGFFGAAFGLAFAHFWCKDSKKLKRKQLRKAALDKFGFTMDQTKDPSIFNVKSITKEYRHQAMKAHPDRPTGSKEKFNQLQVVYATLIAMVDEQDGTAPRADKKEGPIEQIGFERQKPVFAISFEDWLTNTVDLGQFLDAFIETGCGQLDDILEIDEKFLTEDVGIKKQMHVKRIMRHVNEFKAAAKE